MPGGWRGFGERDTEGGSVARLIAEGGGRAGPEGWPGLGQCWRGAGGGAWEAGGACSVRRVLQLNRAEGAGSLCNTLRVGPRGTTVSQHYDWVGLWRTVDEWKG